MITTILANLPEDGSPYAIGLAAVILGIATFGIVVGYLLANRRTR